MIQVSDEFMERVLADNAIMHFLMLFEFNVGEDVAITDAQNPITIGGRTYSKDNGALVTVVTPQTGSRLSRNLYQLVLHDDDSFFWSNRLRENGNHFTFHLYVVYRTPAGGYTEALKIYSGRSSQVSHSSGGSPYTITVQLVGSFLQTDGEVTPVTTQAAQFERDPNDTAFRFAGVLREQSWGGGRL